MKEQILVINGLSSSELLRTFAKLGKNTLNLRVMSGAELANYALIKSGVCVSKRLVVSKEIPAIIYSFLKEIPYFKSASYSDAESFASAIHKLRSLIIAEDEETAICEGLEKGEFIEKNHALMAVYKKYLEILDKNNLIDSDGVIRRACYTASKLDAEIITIKEYTVSPLETLLLKRVSNENAKELSFSEIVCKTDEEGEIVDISEGYGEINEVENIISTILASGKPLDQFLISTSNPQKYAQMMFDIASQTGVPISFGTGIPITNTYPAKLLKLMYTWNTLGYHGADSLREMLQSNAFDIEKLSEELGYEQKMGSLEIEQLVKKSGSLRLSFDVRENKRKLDAYHAQLEKNSEKASDLSNRERAIAENELNLYIKVEKFSDELSLGLASFMEKYSVIRNNELAKFDVAALNTIVSIVRAFCAYSSDSRIDDIVPELFKKMICAEISREGAIHFDTIEKSLGSLRNNIFICGMSSEEFPGKPVEDYLLLDNDLLAFGNEADLPTSNNRIINRINAFNNTMRAALSLGSNISISYSGYNLADLKKRNPSSVLYGIYEIKHPGATMDDFFENISYASYFQSSLLNSHAVGLAYAKGATLEYVRDIIPEKCELQLEDRAWSPTDIELFFSCPRKFYFTKIVGIPDKQIDNPLGVIPSTDYGILAHRLMERLSKTNMSKEDFLSICEEDFYSFLVERPPVHVDDAERIKQEFIIMMGNAYNQDPKNEVISAEEKYTFSHPVGIDLKGYPDRLERDEHGNYIIVDYKTKRKVEHRENNIDSCLQIVIYAWLCEQAGYKVSRGEYRYIYKNRIVRCKYDDEMKWELEAKLRKFKTALEEKTFVAERDEQACKYCSQKALCTAMINQQKVNEHE